MSALAADLDVRLSTMTGIVDQLQSKKMVERVGHPSDRRSLHVRLTPKGHKLYRAAHEAFLSHLEPLVEQRTPASRRQILEFLADLIPAIQGWREHPRKVERRGRAHSSS
jgi:DNA-binding MarR family transcriptional regulator